MEHKHDPSPMHVYCLSSDCTFPKTVLGLNRRTSHLNTSSALSSSENPIPWPQYLPHSQKQEPPNLKLQPRGQQAWPVTWHGDMTLGVIQHRPSLPHLLPTTRQRPWGWRILRSPKRDPTHHPQSSMTPILNQRHRDTSNVRVITIKWGVKVSKDLNLPPLTYNLLLEPGYISVATLPLLMFSALSHTCRLITGCFSHFSSRKINVEAEFFFFLSRETVF